MIYPLLISFKAIPYKDPCIVLTMNICHYNATMASTVFDNKCFFNNCRGQNNWKSKCLKKNWRAVKPKRAKSITKIGQRIRDLHEGDKFLTLNQISKSFSWADLALAKMFNHATSPYYGLWIRVFVLAIIPHLLFFWPCSRSRFYYCSQSSNRGIFTLILSLYFIVVSLTNLSHILISF